MPDAWEPEVQREFLTLGHDIVGIDCFTSYYVPQLKRANIAALLAEPRFRLVDADLTTADLGPLLDGDVAARGLPHAAF